MKNIRETIKTIVKEESEYQAFFRKALEKTGKSIPSMSDDEKKAFFNKIDAAWDSKGEKNEGNAFGAAVVKAKEAGEDEFEVGGKTFKVESVNEGKKRFKQQDGVGSSKYTISYHDGKKKHKDGSDFFDIKIFKNKPELEAFKKDLVSKGFISESVNENNMSVVWMQDHYEKGKKIKMYVVPKAKASTTAYNLKNRYRDDMDTEVGIMTLDQWNKLPNSQKDLTRESVNEVDEGMESGHWVGFTKTPKGKKLAHTFKSGNQAKAWAIKNNGGAMPKKDWDEKEAKYAVEGVNERKFEVDDLVYNKRTKTVGIVRMREERGEVKTDADGNVNSDELEKYNPTKHGKAKIAPSTQKEISKRGLYSPLKNESVNEAQYKDAIAKFNDVLIKHPMVKKAAEHYKKSPSDIVKVLQQRLVIKGDRGGNAKEVSINFNDTNSGISIKHKETFNEDVNENFSPSDIEKIKKAVEGATSFMGIGTELKKIGMKYGFMTSPHPIYMIKKGAKTYVLINKKYADNPEFVIGDTAGGLLENKSVTESKFKKGDKLKHKTSNTGTFVVLDDRKGLKVKNLNTGRVFNNLLNKNEYEIVTESKFKSGDTAIGLLEGYLNEQYKHLISISTPKELFSKKVLSQIEALAKKGIRSREIGLKLKFVGDIDPIMDDFRKLKNKIYFKLDKRESVNEGNAFGMAVTKAKKEGKTEFEFNGKMYKVKKGSYEKNEAAKKLAEKSEVVAENTHVVVSIAKDGYGTLMSGAVDMKMAERLKKATTTPRGEELKVITVSDAKNMKGKLIGGN